MIKKLRIKFVIINMSIVTLLLSVILGMTYYSTRTKMENQSVEMMQRIAAAPFRRYATLETGEEMHLPYFAIRLGPNGEYLATGGGYYDLTNQEIDQLVRKFCHSRMGVIPEYNLRYCRVDAPHSRYLVFTDISSEIQTLRSLMHTCILIGVVGFLGFLGASILLSGWAVGPVDRAFRQQRQFVADASHELKTPLTVIMTNAQLMQDFQGCRNVEEKSLGNIMTMSDQMKNLIEQMLTLAKSDYSHQKTAFAPVELGKLCARGVLPFEPVFFEKGLTLETDIDETTLVRGDPGQLRQVLEILLDNARKYSKAGGTTWVTLKALGKHRCRLTVADEGEPISQEELDRTFERFYCADPSRTCKESFGLGLAIARSIAQGHRGRLWAECKNGITSYHLDLPIA